MKNIRTLDFNLLKAFEALLDEGNVTRAAERMAVTQPAMSAMLARLRESFDDVLFVREQHGIRPTERAVQLGISVKNVLAEINLMLQPLTFSPPESHIKISIASTDYGLQAVALPFVAELKKHAPHIKVALLPIQDSSVRGLLEQGRLDIALINPERIHSDYLHMQPLYDEHYVCLMRENHPAAAKPLDLDTFCSLDFAMMSYDGGGFSGATDDALAALGRTRRVSLSLTNFLLLSDILRRSDMVAMTPSRLACRQPGLVMRHAPLAIQGFGVCMVWHERTHAHPAHQWIRSLMAHVAAAQDAPAPLA